LLSSPRGGEGGKDTSMVLLLNGPFLWERVGRRHPNRHSQAQRGGGKSFFLLGLAFPGKSKREKKKSLDKDFSPS